MKKDFGVYLREKRIEKGFTVSQLNLYSGVSTAQLSRIENGKRGAPKAENIKKIANALSIPYEEMMAAAGHEIESEIEEKNNWNSTSPELTIKDEEFEAFANDPELERWYKDLPNSDEEDLQSLKQMWEIIRKNKK